MIDSPIIWIYLYEKNGLDNKESAVNIFPELRLSATRSLAKHIFSSTFQPAASFSSNNSTTPV